MEPAKKNPAGLRRTPEALLIQAALTVILLGPFVAFAFWGIHDVLGYAMMAGYAYIARRIWLGLVWRRTWY